MSTPERATIHVVTPGTEDAAAAAPPTPPAAPPSPEPEAQPPGMITAAEVEQPPEPDLGGPTIPSPTVGERIEASGGSLADQLKATWTNIASTEEFDVPGWERPDGSPALIIVARTFGDKKALNAGVSNEVYIAKSTHQLLYVQDDGTRAEIPGGWGKGLAEMIGVDVAKAADLVSLVISKPDPNNPTVRIPNVAGIHALAAEMIAWARKSTREAEENLGE